MDHPPLKVAPWTGKNQPLAMVVFETELLDLARQGVAPPSKKGAASLLASTGEFDAVDQMVSKSGNARSSKPTRPEARLLRIQPRVARQSPSAYCGSSSRCSSGGRSSRWISAPRGHHREPSRRVFQLAYVAAPVQGQFISLIAWHQGLASRLPNSRAARCRKWSISSGMSSRRSRSDGRCTRMTFRSMEQVLAEAALRHQLFQVLVGGGDDPHVRLASARGPPTGVELRRPPARAAGGSAFGWHVADPSRNRVPWIGLL